MNILRAGLYALAFLWTLLITALIGNVIYDAIGGTPSSINYVMFVAVWSWLTIFVGIAGSFTEAIPPIALLGMDALAVLFTFIAAVELAAKLGVHSCFNSDYVSTNDQITGSYNLTKRCQQLQASTAFLWFLFATFSATLILSAMSSRGGIGGGRGGIRRGPAMSQV